MPENSDYGILPSFKAEEYVWIKRKLPLDLLSIDDELMEIPVLIQQAGEMTSTAIEIRERAKDDLDSARASAADKLRSVTRPNGKERSESQITSELPLSEDVQEKQKILSDSRLDAALWQSLVEALRSKNSAIRVVADLLNSGFLTTSAIMEKRRSQIRSAHPAAGK